VKQAISAFPGWTINDVLDTDIEYLHKILFKKQEKPKEKAVPLADFIRTI